MQVHVSRDFKAFCAKNEGPDSALPTKTGDKIGAFCGIGN